MKYRRMVTREVPPSTNSSFWGNGRMQQAPLLSSQSSFDEVRALTIGKRTDSSGKSVTNDPKRWLPLASSLKRLAKLVQLQINYVEGTSTHNASLPNFLVSSCLQENNSGEIEYNFGSDAHFDHLEQLPVIPSRKENKMMLDTTPQKGGRKKASRIHASTPKKVTVRSRKTTYLNPEDIPAIKSTVRLVVQRLRDYRLGVRKGYRGRPDSRGAPGSFKCPVYSTNTLHPRLTSLAEDCTDITLLPWRLSLTNTTDWMVLFSKSSGTVWSFSSLCKFVRRLAIWVRAAETSRPKPIRNVVTNVNRKGYSSTAIYNFAMDRLQRTHLPTADSVLERRGKQNGNLDVSAARTQIASLLTNLQRLENDHTVPEDLLKSTIQSSP
ncbi:hypothetical protein DPMN_025586 [Dreissena polymorpha]|uniref:Uncharacterized protein n=1 Tax=Dreissena polymorpha TaxID=45954 RepID=A0A9D4LTJ0_DREPO|nr:hypothetical protein DPMN_025586 [Dreissena polymorpha]